MAAWPARRIRLTELSATAQAFVILAALTVFLRCLQAAPDPWWSPLPVLLTTLGFMHVWQRKPIEGARGASTEIEASLGFLAVMMTASWMNAFVDGTGWLTAAAAAAMIALVYGLVTRAWAVALGGQLFTGIAVWQFAAQLILGHPHWAAALAPIGTVAATGLLGSLFARYRWPELPPAWDYAWIGTLCRSLSGLMLAAWSFEYVPAEGRVAFFAGVGALQIAIGSLIQSRTRIVVGCAYGAAGFLFFVLNPATTMFNLVAILTVPASLRWGTKWAGEAAVPEEARQVLTAAALCCTWRWVTLWGSAHGLGGQLTALWGVLALLVLGAGLGLRDRVYRLGGFVILAVALGRLFLFDVWNFDTIYRIVSFLVLGAVLLGLSFVYHRFAETMRRWL